MYAIIASTALLASTALAGSVGSAVVVNKCNYDVTLCNVPAADGGYSEIDQTLSSGDTYTQQWTELSNGDGWSIKLSNDTTLDDILQYEYTFHNDGTIWYDLSEVNGNPWDGNWEITAASASSTCSPKQQAYRYATDDAYGMQACPQDSTITVTLCSGESQDDGAAASASSSVAAETSSLETATSVSSYATPTTSIPAYTYAASTSESSEASSTPAPTTLATSVVSTTLATSTSSSAVTSTEAGGATVTEVETAVVTNVVTYTHWHGHRHTKRAAATAARHAH